jgi:FlaA1/EpsC-like NDP-sugar epimerase
MLNRNFNLDQFIKDHVVYRQESLFINDLEKHQDQISNFLNHARVLVIGGAGTIGSSYIKALLKHKPSSLIVVDKDENGLAELVRDLRSSTDYNIPEEFICYPFNYASEAFKQVFQNSAAFDLVANFAAHKHVRSEKDKFSIQAMLENNVFHLYDLLEQLKSKPPKIFFSVSTDKAANPVNVMGASKKMMEELMFSYTDVFKVRSARFANVAFSNGSLPFAFLKRIEKRQPLSGPSDVKRYFVSPEESGQICLLASLVPEGHTISFPKLDAGRDMKTFAHIAEKLLSSLGFEIAYCDSEQAAKAFNSDGAYSSVYPVCFFDTDTSGEKMFEEFFTEDEEVDFATMFEMGVINKKDFKDKNDLAQIIQSLKKAFNDSTTDKADIVEIIKSFISDFQHIETGKNLDQKM